MPTAPSEFTTELEVSLLVTYNVLKLSVPVISITLSYRWNTSKSANA